MNRFERILNRDKPAAAKPKKQRLPKPAPPPPPKSFDEKLRDNDYHTKLPYPGARDPDMRAKRQAYHEDQARLEAEFKADMFAYYDVTGHPKAQRAYEIAWSHGHAAGYSEVDIYFSELAELLQP